MHALDLSRLCQLLFYKQKALLGLKMYMSMATKKYKKDGEVKPTAKTKLGLIDLLTKSHKSLLQKLH